jgi:hypothetical protein
MQAHYQPPHIRTIAPDIKEAFLIRSITGEHLTS